MPNPTQDNRLSFKTYLRANKQKFTSGIQTCILGDIQNAILTINSGIDTSQVTRVILFDDGERVGLSTVLEEKQLFYVPGLPDDSIIIGVGTDGEGIGKSYRGYKLTFVGDGQGIQYGNQVYGLNSTIGLGTDASLTILGLGGGLFLPGDPPTYTITPSSTNVNEGDTVSFAVTTTNVGVGTTLFYSIVGSISGSDFLDNSLTGSFVVQSISNGVGSAVFTKTIVNDVFYDEGIEAFEVNILTGSSGSEGTVVATSSTIFVNDIGEPSYTLSQSASIINEGEPVTFTITAENVTSGTELYYTISGDVSADDFVDNTLSGSFVVIDFGNGIPSGTVTKISSVDLIQENPENFIFEVRTVSTSGTIVATSSTVTINNTQPTFSVTPSVFTINEGESITFTVSTNLPSGTILYYTLAGNVNSADFTDNTVSGSITIINISGQSIGTLTKSITRDRKTEGDENFSLQLRLDSILGTLVATSNSVIIKDTSRNVGENANGRTFGPVQVNRDNGNTNLSSDWYNICNIDSLPEGSKIALFIDTSGSMTQATIQASYDLLLSKLAEKNISIITVTNPNEDWITPFLTDLN
jgi:hypothetical protein